MAIDKTIIRAANIDPAVKNVIEQVVDIYDPLVEGLSPTELAALDGVVAGTAAANKAVVLGAAKEIATITTATITNLNTTAVTFGTGGTLDADSDVVTLSSNAGTVSKMAGVITTETLTTAAAGTQALTITNTLVAATDIILITQNGGTNTGGTPVFKAVPGAGSFVITVDNKHASVAFNGTFVIGFLLIKA